VPGVASGQLYGYRVHGVSDPGRGMRFDGSKVLLDPYARGVVITGNSFFAGHERTLLAQQSDSIVVGANVIDRNPDYRVETGDGVVFDRCDGCLMTGVLLVGTRAPAAPAGAAVEVRQCTAVRLAECQILDPEPCGVLLHESADCSVSGCTILDRRSPRRLLEAISVVGGVDNVVERNLTR